MTVINQVMVEVLNVGARELQRRNPGGTQTSTATLDATPSSTTSPAAATTSSNPQASGPTSSPLLFFVALGFGVVFTNLWIIVGVKYCFRYNARNRAIRNGEEVDPINLENMPTRPHRRRREKKLMTMDEVNERFPLTKYKNWVASRAREGLPTSGGVTVTAHPSRAASLRDVDAAMPSSPVGTKHSTNSRPGTADPEAQQTGEITISPATNDLGGSFGNELKSLDASAAEKEVESPPVEEHNALEHVHTTASTADKQGTASSQDDEDDDDHIHTAVPPELLTNPGDTCAICIDTLEEDDDIRGLTCGHAFHAGCLDPWLTSRRACCPLCKADYYVPKPRPEGEAAEATTGRRSRMNMPQPPASAWTGIRGNPRLILPGRFMTPTTPYGYDGPGRARRARRQAAAAQVQSPAQAIETAHVATPDTDAPTAENNDTAASRRWRPRMINPFNSISMPTVRIPRRNRQAESTSEQGAATESSPSQLEAGEGGVAR